MERTSYGGRHAPYIGYMPDFRQGTRRRHTAQRIEVIAHGEGGGVFHLVISRIVDLIELKENKGYSTRNQSPLLYVRMCYCQSFCHPTVWQADLCVTNNALRRRSYQRSLTL
jgi:hypothetical protein